MRSDRYVASSVFATAAAAAVAVMVLGASSPRAQQPPPRHVVMISIDGLKPETYTAAGPSKVPTLRRLAQEGAYATGVIGVTPTVTYPSHTTMITGVLPAVHGIYNNTILDPEGTSNGSWYWYARDVVVPTLPRVVKARGLTTAAVSWPVTVGEDIDYLMPEFGGVTRHPKWLDLIRAISEPRGLLEAYEADGRKLSWPLTDDDRTGVAAWIVRKYRPRLLLLHIFGTDDAQHAHGPGSPQALAAIEAADAHVRQVVTAVADAGLEAQTDFVIVSDHGFLPLERQLHVNHAFKREGLLEVDQSGKISRWDAYFHGAGGSGFVMLKNPDDRALTERVGKLLRDLAADPANGILSIADREELRKRGADPRASFNIDMRNGFYTGGGHDVLLAQTTSKGGHGFAPTRPELHASLIMRGPDVPKAGSLGVVRMTQIGPTIAGWFGVKLSPQADAPLDFRAAKPAAAAEQAAPKAQPLRVALTFDDLPSHGPLPPGMTRVDLAKSILATLQKYNAPLVYGFINAKKVDEVPADGEVLKLWRAAGYPLGNHAFSHMDLHANTAEAFEADVLANEASLRSLMAGGDWHWFRYPYLREGDTPEKYRGVRAALKTHGYRVAQVTMDFNDYAYNAPYARCLAQKDTASIALLEQSYLDRAGQSITRGQDAARALFGRDINHVMLLHIGGFETVMLPRLLDLLRDRGIVLTTLEEAQSDPAYATVPDRQGNWSGTLLNQMRPPRPDAPPAARQPEPPQDVFAKLSSICNP